MRSTVEKRLDDFERLRRVVDADPALQAELLAYTESQAFVASLARIAERHDLIVAEAVIWRALEEGRAVWYSTWG